MRRPPPPPQLPPNRRKCRPTANRRSALPSVHPSLARSQAIFFAALALTCSAMPVVTFVFSLQFAATQLGPFAYTFWAIVGVSSALAVLAHAAGSRRARGGWLAVHCCDHTLHEQLANVRQQRHSTPRHAATSRLLPPPCTMH